MIIEHDIEGSKDTSFHDFQLTLQQGMNLTISSGSYYLANTEVYKNDSDYIETITSPSVSTDIEIWVTKSGFALITGDSTSQTLTDPIDKLIWFTVPAGCTDISGLSINFIKIIES